VHVTNFLDLECALETSGILESTTHDKQRARDLESLCGELLEALILVKHGGDLLREGMKTGNNLVAALGERDAILRELERHHNECDILRRIGLYPASASVIGLALNSIARTHTHLGTGYTDFRTSVDVHTAVGFTRNRRAHSVHDTDAKCTPLKAVLQCKDSIGCLTRLGEEHADIVTEDGGLTVQKVAGKLDAHRNLGELLEDGACGNARVVAGPARDEDNTTASANDGEVGAQTAKGDFVRVEVNAATHGVDDRLGLLVDFLLHEVVELALHDLGELEFKGLNRADGALLTVGLALAQSVDVQLSLSDVGDVIIFEVENTLGVLDDCGSVGSDEELDGLRETVVGHECARLGTGHLSTRSGWGEEGVVSTANGWRLGFRDSRFGGREFDIDEIDLEFLFSLDANEERRTATSSDDFVGVVGALEDECERALIVGVNGVTMDNTRSQVKNVLGVPSRRP